MTKFTCIEEVLNNIKNVLDTPLEKKETTKISILYALNASGKTRLTRLFEDQNKEKVLCYSAFIEDIFSWDNDDIVLKFNKNSWIFKIIQMQGVDKQITLNFQKFTASKLEPSWTFEKEQINFIIPSSNLGNLKISRGEESIFIWSIFYTILEIAIAELNTSDLSNRTTNDFNKIQYVIVDDPVSSIDDTRIITVALELVELIKKSNTENTQLKFLITTHHPLFFNVLFNAREKNWNKKNYILSKSEQKYTLKKQGDDSPFAYHHDIIAEINNAIKKRDIRRYHFNLFRCLLEKTSNFLGYKNKNTCLSTISNAKTQDGLSLFKKTLNHYSHNSLWDLEPKNVSDEEQIAFEQIFKAFIDTYNWEK